MQRTGNKIYGSNVYMTNGGERNKGELKTASESRENRLLQF